MRHLSRKVATLWLGTVLSISTLLISASPVAAVAASTPYGCWGQTISIWTTVSSRTIDPPRAAGLFPHSFKITVSWCNDATGAYYNGGPTYANVSGTSFPNNYSTYATNHGSPPNRYVTYDIDRYTNAAYSQGGSAWCKFAFHAEVRVNRDGSGSLTSMYLYTYDEYTPGVAYCDPGDLTWSGGSW